MYSTETKAHRTDVSKSKTTKVVLKIRAGNRTGSLVQTTTTSTETWVGLSKDNADNITVASENLRTVGIKFTNTEGETVAWAAKDNLEGQTIQSQMQRMGDSNLYQVTKTTTTYETTAKGGCDKYYLD